MKTHLSFIQVEAQSQGGQFSQIKTAQLKLEKDVGRISEEMIQMKADSGSMRQTLQFLSKNELIISMPGQLKKFYNRNDFERISKLFQQAFPYLKRYKGMKIFEQVYLEIDRVLQMSQDLVISQIEKNLDNKRKMTEFTNILLDLQYDYQGETNLSQQRSHIVTGNMQMGDKRGSVMTESEETHNLIKMIMYLEKKLAENIKMNTDMEAAEKAQNEQQNNNIVFQQTGLSNPVEQQDRNRKLKMINSILFDSDRLVNFMFQNNISSNQRKLKIKDIEQYFTENMPKFENFYTLLQSYQDGEYDYKLPIKGGKPPNRRALKHFQLIFEALRKAAKMCVDEVEKKYKFKDRNHVSQTLFQFTEEQLSQLKSQLIRDKEDAVSCSKIVFLLKTLDQKVKLGGKQILDLQDKINNIIYIIQLFELRAIQLEKYDFYNNLAVNKTFTNEDEFISPFCTILFECLLEDIEFLTNLKTFNPQVDLYELDKNFLLDAIEICFRCVFFQVMKEHNRLQAEESEFIQATGNYAFVTISSDQVYLILVSNIISFQQNQCRLLLQQIFDQQQIKLFSKVSQLSAAGTALKNKIDESINQQVTKMSQLMDKMVKNLRDKLCKIKAQQILEENLDLFTSWNNNHNNQSQIQQSQQSQSARSSTAQPPAENTQFKFDSNTLAPSQKQNDNFSLAKYEVRYKILDILSEFDQYLELISLNCCSTLIRTLPELLLIELLEQIENIIKHKSQNTNVLMLKQLRIELEFFQEATNQIKSTKSNQFFQQIYGLLDKIFKEKFSSNPINEQVYRVDSTKLRDMIRSTKYKSQLNFKFFS